jgi:hypothetical protein
MDPITIGAVLLAIASGAGEGLGKELWDGVVALVRRPFHRKAATSGDAVAAEPVPAADAQLAAFQQAPADRERAVALAETLLARSGADADFRQALEHWWRQAEPIRASFGNVMNAVSGGTQQGPVLMGRDFTNVAFGSAQAPPPVPPSYVQGMP